MTVRIVLLGQERAHGTEPHFSMGSALWRSGDRMRERLATRSTKLQTMAQARP
jgi:hypothetical protein